MIGIPGDHRSHDAAALPPVGLWWPMLEADLRREVLEDLDAPLREGVVRRILDLCEVDGDPRALRGVRLREHDRAYIAGWSHAIGWN
ncbi:hypothetical protein [Agromyces mangrovi Wang et al. 2018]|uniref:hypothetical protein n=1 Tax=Agromyces mangrovi TaxID=1858653 RepID=UPI0025737ECB|nr:hypothetical protein [Agromyces mangrovi]BDZ63645.1 hypothetical protein GCM10025877_05830 [Agromyces mangrovi]